MSENESMHEALDIDIKRAKQIFDISLNLCKESETMANFILNIEKRDDLSLREKLWLCTKAQRSYEAQKAIEAMSKKTGNLAEFENIIKSLRKMDLD